MKLKNTLGIVIASVVAVGAQSAFAQGQGAVEVEAFAKRYFTDSSRHVSDGNLYGGSVSYFLTEAVSLGLSYGEYHRINADHRLLENGTKRQKIKGSLASLDATYHFRSAADKLRPYISASVAHQSLGNVKPGAGVKYYVADHFFVRAGVDGMYGLDSHQGEWMAGLGMGLNFGGSSKKAAPAVEPVAYTEIAAEESVEMLRVELEVLFDFDKAQVKQGSYSDIENLAAFMREYPELTTTVEGYTDSTGPEAYNQQLSERRANAVRNVLVDEFGVDADRVSAVGYGEANPVADNATREGRALNRRVEAAVEIIQTTEAAVGVMQ